MDDVVNGQHFVPVQRRRPAHFAPQLFDGRATIIFVTICTKHRRSILAHDGVHDLLRRWWLDADHWLVGNYMILPDHIHFFCSPGHGTTSLRRWIAYWKNGTSREHAVLDGRSLWQRDYWDWQIRNGRDYTEKWSYVANNPVRKGFVAMPEEWPYQGEIWPIRWRDSR